MPRLDQACLRTGGCNLWLLVLAVAHYLLLFEGDVLVAHALSGFVLYSLRNLPSSVLVVLGWVPFGVGPP